MRDRFKSLLTVTFLEAETVQNVPKMGRRKSKRQAPQKRKAIEPMDIQFTCPFCNHEKSCDVKMDKCRNTARISCRVCLEDYQTTVNVLSEPIDVYNDWIDACDAIN